MAALKEAITKETKELLTFNRWSKTAGKHLDFDAPKYEQTAVKKAQAYWAPSVRQLQETTGYGEDKSTNDGTRRGETMRCLACGHENREGAMLCTGCGHPLAERG